ncbi:PilZ domain-containing protein [Novosphingobium sp. ZN18A2]|uniref:PilZ domain-containing protein n=1 Tax=Novosphingobium sp. ZN18A2 TaxID=3079861 RepID=UPI0030D2C3AB
MRFDGADAGKGGRPPLLIKVRKGPLETPDVVVLELTLAGCMVEWEGWALKEGQRVLVSFPTLSNVAAKVLWIEDGRMGVLFDDLLHQAVFDHLTTG